MPLIQVDLERELFETSHAEIGDAIHDAQIEALGIPADDRFQVFSPHGVDELKFDPGYNDVDRRSLLLIRVTAVHMYPAAVKRRFFEARIADIYDKKGGALEFVVRETRVTNQNGEHVADLRSVIVHRAV